MYAVIPPLPTNAGVAPIAEHRPRRDGPSQHAAKDTPNEDAGARPGDQEPSPREHPATVPPAEDPAMDSETLFTTALLANQLPARPPSADEMRLHNNHGWLPPDSPLRLKDKLI